MVGNGKREKEGSFPFPIHFPPPTFIFPLSNLSKTQRGLCGGLSSPPKKTLKMFDNKTFTCCLLSLSTKCL